MTDVGPIKCSYLGGYFYYSVCHENKTFDRVSIVNVPVLCWNKGYVALMNFPLGDF